MVGGTCALPDQTAPDDAGAVTNGNALRAAAAVLYTNELVLSGTYTVDTDIDTFPKTAQASWTMRSGGPTAGGAKGMTTGPAIRIFNFDGCQGPEKRIVGIQTTGPGAIVRDSGFYTSNTNGMMFEDCWCRGNTYGGEFDGGSQICGRGFVAEYCSVGIRWGTSLVDTGKLCIWSDSAFYNNAIDVYCSAWDYNGLIMGNSSHIATHNKCYFFDGASNVNVGVVVADGQNPPSTTARERVATIHCEGATNITVQRVVSRDCQDSVLLEESTDCEIGSLDSDNADRHLAMAGVTTARNRVAQVRARGTGGSTTGMDLDTLGLGNLVEHPDIQGCTVGLRLATDVGTIEINDGTITGNADDAILPGVLGDLDPANGQIDFLYTDIAMGRRIMYGADDPTGVIAGLVGDQWMDTTGGLGATLYVLTSGGWEAP